MSPMRVSIAWTSYAPMAARICSAASTCRWLRALTSPLIPAVLLFRIVRQVRRKRRHGKELARALPFLLAFLAAWTSGELIGTLRGQR